MHIGNLTFDCEDALVVGGFWSQTLGRPLDPGADSGFCSIGRSDAGRTQPAWFFERVPERKTAKNRMHLDIIDPDPGTVDRLVTLGASIVAEHGSGVSSHHWTVMMDPEGNEFCLSSDSYVG
ncbi:MAG TPA: VOC family protein [Acidimicrobiales bacterium]|nr:VOC family protein [Acidimicrobiales bacterium]